jgi:hypothetical protein
VTRHDSMTHDQAIELLPWLVNGSLAGEEYTAVSDHAASCVVCRRELGELEVLQQSISALGAHADLPVPDMRRINARIDAQLERETRKSSLVDAWQQFSTSHWRLAFVVQTAVLVAVVAILLIPREPTPEFTTLSTPEALPAGHYLRIVFDPTLSDVAVAEIVETSGLLAIAGPSDRGVVTLQFPATVDASERESALASLQDDDRVLFAQSVEGGN